jgi:hypothetical protein
MELIAPASPHLDFFHHYLPSSTVDRPRFILLSNFLPVRSPKPN